MERHVVMLKTGHQVWSQVLHLVCTHNLMCKFHHLVLSQASSSSSFIFLSFARHNDEYAVEQLTFNFEQLKVRLQVCHIYTLPIHMLWQISRLN